MFCYNNFRLVILSWGLGLGINSSSQSRDFCASENPFCVDALQREICMEHNLGSHSLWCAQTKPKEPPGALLELKCMLRVGATLFFEGVCLWLLIFN